MLFWHILLALSLNTCLNGVLKLLLRITKWYLTVILRGRAGYELIYITNEAVGRVGYYQLISGKSEKNNCFSKFSSSPITGNCHSTHLFPLHKTYSENITWPVINARSSWKNRPFKKYTNVSFFKKSYNFERTKSVTMWHFSLTINCSAGLAVVVVNLDVAVAEIVLRSWEDLSTTCDERCAVCTGL